MAEEERGIGGRSGSPVTVSAVSGTVVCKAFSSRPARRASSGEGGT
jgi:hypothetical protein